LVAAFDDGCASALLVTGHPHIDYAYVLSILLLMMMMLMLLLLSLVSEARSRGHVQQRYRMRNVHPWLLQQRGPVAVHSVSLRQVRVWPHPVQALPARLLLQHHRSHVRQLRPVSRQHSYVPVSLGVLLHALSIARPSCKLASALETSMQNGDLWQSRNQMSDRRRVSVAGTDLSVWMLLGPRRR
jgi:hypothetical protein